MKGKLEPSERQKLIEEGKVVMLIMHLHCTCFLNSSSGFSNLHAGKNLKEGLLALEEDLLKLIDDLQQEAQCIPNITHPDVPIGGEDCSTIRKTVLFTHSLTLSLSLARRFLSSFS